VTRHEYQQRARELAPRGAALPQTKLTPEAVREIRRIAAEREQARARITALMSNAAIAERFGVSVRAVERTLAYEVHINV
jgi:hypothetical protein